MNEIYITYVLMGLAIIVSLKGFNDAHFTDQYLYKPYNVKHHKEYYRIISHQFLHADPTHLIFNMIGLYFFGPVVEDIFRIDYGMIGGGTVFLVFFLLGGIFSTTIPYLRHKDNDLYRSLGASGAVSAIIFAGILFRPDMQMGLIFLPIFIPSYIFGPLYLLVEFLSDRYGKSRIAHDAHIGGALFGILFVLITNIDRVKLFINYLIS